MVRVLRLLSNLQCDSARQCNVLAVSQGRDDVLRVRSEIRTCFVDEVTLGVSLDGDHLASLQWEGDGCSISRASLSMMTDLTQGKSAEEIGRLYRDMEVMMHSRNLGVDDEILDDLGDAAALESTSQFANRVKCALLGWYALRDAMAKSGIDISTAGEPADQ